MLYFLLINIEARKEERMIKGRTQVLESDQVLESIINQSKSNGTNNTTETIIIPVIPYKQ
tara:strand:+ start:3622 stop:3801 length:180 start_codon:yes stop_codon:yes gene_type:complete